MLEQSHFRIYYSGASTTWIEDIKAPALAQAVRRAELRRAHSADARYFEIWQETNLLATSADQRLSVSRPT